MSGWSAYAKRRNTSPDTVAGHTELAAFCRRQGLQDQERLHWAYVWRYQPDHKDAIRALGLKKHGNTWLTSAALKLHEQQEQQEAAAKQRWQPVLARLRQSFTRGDAGSQQQAAAELQAIQDPAAIPVLEAVWEGADQAFWAELVQARHRKEGPATPAGACGRGISGASWSRCWDGCRTRRRHSPCCGSPCSPPPLWSRSGRGPVAAAVPLQLRAAADGQPRGADRAAILRHDAGGQAQRWDSSPLTRADPMAVYSQDLTVGVTGVPTGAGAPRRAAAPCRNRSGADEEQVSDRLERWRNRVRNEVEQANRRAEAWNQRISFVL